MPAGADASREGTTAWGDVAGDRLRAVQRSAFPSDGAGCPAAGLSIAEVAETAAWVASVQLPDGMVPWYRGGHADPWNHVEATMALAAAGRSSEVERAFAWLSRQQLPDGSWCAAYVPGGVLEPHRDTNACAYVATGAWWCSQAGMGPAFLGEQWPMVKRALSWCVRQQLPGGEIAWSVGPDGVRANWALLAANSSLHLSLRCAGEIARALGEDPSRWDDLALSVGRAVAQAVAGRTAPAAGRAAVAASVAGGARPTGHRSGFVAKDRWAMDWYYPVLTGTVVGAAARRRLSSRWRDFVVPGLGSRCVSDRFWVTAAETAECAMATFKAGLAVEARELLAATRHLRHPSGAYWTGCAHPECRRFPGGELSTYSAGAVLIADHVLAGRSPAAGIFAGQAEGPALRSDR